MTLKESIEFLENLAKTRASMPKGFESVLAVLKGREVSQEDFFSAIECLRVLAGQDPKASEMFNELLKNLTWAYTRTRLHLDVIEAEEEHDDDDDDFTI